MEPQSQVEQNFIVTNNKNFKNKLKFNFVSRSVSNYVNWVTFAAPESIKECVRKWTTTKILSYYQNKAYGMF